MCATGAASSSSDAGTTAPSVGRPSKTLLELTRAASRRERNQRESESERDRDIEKEIYRTRETVSVRDGGLH